MATETQNLEPVNPTILIVEPFYGGSHRQLVDLLCEELGNTVYTLITLSAKKWPWRARTSALYLSQTIPHFESFRLLFCSSTLNLAELIALRPDLRKLKKVIYFHENQLVYPVRKQKDRDFQYGYNQIISSLVADVVLFNSHFNKESFLEGIKGHLNLMPDHRPKELDMQIKEKCTVVYFPLNFPVNLGLSQSGSPSPVPAAEYIDSVHILWPHRWEHDKNPEMFFRVIFRLQEEGVPFRVSVLGEQYADVPAIFQQAKQRLENHIVNWGFVESKEDYYSALKSSHVVVSTAEHEFFGVAIMESVHCGCVPLCPNKLVYPELFPRECLYNTENQLFKRLKYYCKNPNLINHQSPKLDLTPFSWSILKATYMSLLSI